MIKSLRLVLIFTCFATAAFAQAPIPTTTQAAMLLTRGDVKGAIAILDKGIAKKADLFESYKMRSMLRSMAGDLQGSLDDISAAIEIKRDDGDLYERRAMARMNLNQDAALILKDLNDAIALGKKLDRIYNIRASFRRNLGDENGAIEDYQSSISIRPENPGSHAGLASIYLRRGEDDKAIELLQNFLAMYEKASGSETIVGKIVATSSVPIQSQPNTGAQGVQTVVVVEGRPIIRVPQSREEMEKSNQYREDVKNISFAYSTLAAAYTKKSEYERALPIIETAVNIDNNDFFAYETRGRIRLAMGDYQNAVGDLNVSIKTFPGNPPIYLDRGIALLMLGKEVEAQKDFDKYLELFPRGKDALVRRIDEAKAKLPK